MSFRPYSCEACGKGFYRRYLKDNHVRLCPYLLSGCVAPSRMTPLQHHVDSQMSSSEYSEMTSKDQQVFHGLNLEPQMIRFGTPSTTQSN
jgi:hypothetical protein